MADGRARHLSGGWPPRTGARLAAAITMTVAVLAGGLTGCAPRYQPSDASAAIAAGVAAGVPRLRLTVLDSATHDPTAWTEGLEIADGMLYEGTGLSGLSRLRELDLGSRQPRRSAALPASRYGEGITVVGARIWQLTWRDQVAVEWDRPSLTVLREVPAPGEGWGLCHTSDGRLIASDGSDRLRVHSPEDFASLGSIEVRVGGRPLAGLNELECVPGAVWANVYPTDWLVRIDLATGTVNGAVDAAGLLPAGQRRDADVLNGIAAVPGTDELLITGKLWPTMFLVRLDG